MLRNTHLFVQRPGYCQSSKEVRNTFFIKMGTFQRGVLLCYQVGLKAFHHSFLTSDEGSYVFQGNNFFDGLITREAPPFGRTMQHRMIIQDADVGWLSRYPPLHSLWLVPGVARC